jgi:hypothetical protein
MGELSELTKMMSNHVKVLTSKIEWGFRSLGEADSLELMRFDAKSSMSMVVVATSLICKDSREGGLSSVQALEFEVEQGFWQSCQLR